MKFKIIISAFVLSTLILAGISIAANRKQDSSIVGTWISEKDHKWKMVFTADNCIQYYDGTITDKDYYFIANTSPQCGQVVPIDNYTSYLKLVQVSSGKVQICYEINGITPKSLSLRPVDNGRIFVFDKQ